MLNPLKTMNFPKNAESPGNHVISPKCKLITYNIIGIERHPSNTVIFMELHGIPVNLVPPRGTLRDSGAVSRIYINFIKISHSIEGTQLRALN